jgi:hypothetical protein
MGIINQRLKNASSKVCVHSEPVSAFNFCVAYLLFTLFCVVHRGDNL